MLIAWYKVIDYQSKIVFSFLSKKGFTYKFMS